MSEFFSSLTIEGFKGLNNKTIQFRNLTVLAGSNSVGKSSTIQSLLLIRHTLEEYKRLGQNIERIKINDPYLLALGKTSDISTRDSGLTEIVFTLNFEGNVNMKLTYPIPYTSEIYLEIKASDIELPNQDWGQASIQQPNFHYLNAERVGPRPFYAMNIDLLNVGYQGEFAISILASTNAKVKQVDRLKAFDTEKALLSFQGEQFVSASGMPFVTGGARTLDVETEKWMQFIIPGIEIDAQQIQNNNLASISYGGSKPYNVGFGISYVLPIIVAGLIAEDGDMLIVENPEAHLHPLGQSRIGQFLAKIAAAGVQVVIETHSDYVIDGIRIATLKEDNSLTTDDVVINFFSPNLDTGLVDIEAIFLNKSADLKAYPPYFFDQTQRNFSEIAKLKKQRRPVQ
jgi:predicted ATPase